jgi:hypothetical protein
VCIRGGLVGYFLSKINIYTVLKTKKNFLIIYFIGSMWFLPSLSVLGAVKQSLQIGTNYAKINDYG